MLVQSGVPDNVHFTASRQVVIDARCEPWTLSATARENAGNTVDCPRRPKPIFALPLAVPKGTVEIEVDPYVLFATYVGRGGKHVKLSVLDAATGAPVAQAVAKISDLTRPAGAVIGPLHVHLLGTRQPDCLQPAKFQAVLRT